MPRAVANDSGFTTRRPIAEEAGSFGKFGRCTFTDTRQVVVENEDALVLRITMSVYAGVARTKVTIETIQGYRIARAVDLFAGPRTLVAVRRDDDPFFAQRMPSLFPGLAG